MVVLSWTRVFCMSEQSLGAILVGSTYSIYFPTRYWGFETVLIFSTTNITGGKISSTIRHSTRWSICRIYTARLCADLGLVAIID